MFCKICGLSVDESSMYCSGCGNKLSKDNVALNPLPGNVVHSNDGDAAETANPKLIVIEPQSDERTVEVPKETPITPQAIKPENVMTETPQSATSPIRQSEVIYDTPKTVKPAKPEKQLKGKSKVLGLAIVAVIIVFLIVGVVIFVRNKSDKSPKRDKDSNVATMSDSSGSATDAQETTEIELVDDNQVVSRTITIADNEYNSESLKYYTVENSDASVTVYEVSLNAELLQSYCDEQETLYQLQDSSISDAAYIGNVFRYHYATGYYQYGVMSDERLYVYEISDSIDIEQCDNLAIDYFKTKGVIK